MRVPKCSLIGHFAQVVLITFSLSLASCAQPSPTVAKIGVVAPFDGRYREIGYDVIPAVRLAAREYAERHPANGLVIEITAYDDNGNPELAAQQARNLIQDPQVEIVIGHWMNATTQAALPVYALAHIPVVTYSEQPIPSATDIFNLSPTGTQMLAQMEDWRNHSLPSGQFQWSNADDALVDANAIRALPPTSTTVDLIGGPGWGLGQFPIMAGTTSSHLYFASASAYPQDFAESHWTEAQAATFIRGFEEESLGAAPGLLSVSAYLAAWLAIQRVAAMHGLSIQDTPASGLQFSPDGHRLKAPLYIYSWVGNQPHLIDVLR